MTKFTHDIRQSVVTTVVLMIICGLIFPIFLSGVAGILFPHQAKGSLIEVNGEVVGAEHVGQKFTEDYFMKGRPSAVDYNTYGPDQDMSEVTPSSGSANYAPSNPELSKRVEEDINSFLAANPDVKKEDIPADLMTASGSGLDPEISPASAEIQVPALAEASGISEEKLMSFIEENKKGKLLGIFGEEVVNVLGVNLDIAKEMGII